eukprot:TRINITY_DN14782_c0_g2_i2.p1 TRINITY_DN14782_c0_g2~~TRINITY_DN14782_c0_g2_i2.p1  ORF type:complete len:712 (+),score=212.66 TRINITY_DN14782_c0_g2_i2:72-2138(+)
MDLAHLVEVGLNIAGGIPKGVSAPSASSTAPAKGSGAKKPCVTRFAPSPTGYLHIGGARTALFCYLFAKHHGGQFKLRIEDTDAERNDEGAVAAIVQGMNWLGIKHDGEIVRQSRNINRHKEVAEQLLKAGKAYKCYCTKEELDKERAEAEKAKVPFRYSGKYRDVPADFKPPKGVDPVVRIKTPNDDGVTSWEDGVMGKIEIPNKDIDDFIILRADGTPTYLLAVVVDDHDMGITQVMRGSDHIPNTPRQMAIYRNCGWEMPDFAHFPLIHGPDGKKMSKRHGATGAEQYEALGYLPEAMRNYLARLSWAHGNDEIFTTDQAIEWFSFSGCSRGAPCFDFDKLAALNQHYIKECDVDRLTDILLKFNPDVKPFEQKLRNPRIADLLKVRAKTVVEYREAAEFIVAKRPIGVIPAAAKNIATDAQKGLCTEMADLLRNFKGEWSPEGLEPVIKAFAEGKSMKLGDVAKPVRAALTGLNASPGLFEVIWAVGKDECIGRLEDAAKGVNPTKEVAAAPTAATAAAPADAPPAAKAASPKSKPASAPVVPSGDLDAQVKACGDEIRELKAKLKASGMSGKAIDKTDEVKALVAKLSELKTAQASAPPAPAKASPKNSPKGSPKASPKAKPAAAPAAPAGDLDAQVKACGDEIRELKAKLKASGMSGKAIDKTDEVKALVAKLTELKAAQAK